MMMMMMMVRNEQPRWSDRLSARCDSRVERDGKLYLAKSRLMARLQLERALTPTSLSLPRNFARARVCMCDYIYIYIYIYHDISFFACNTHCLVYRAFIRRPTHTVKLNRAPHAAAHAIE